MNVDSVFGLRSLGNLARVLSASSGLLPLLETAAEEARLALRAASVSLSRLEPGGDLIRVLVNVGDLALTEERFPEHEIYPLSQWGAARQVVSDGITLITSLADSDCDPIEAGLLTALGKGSAVQAAIVVDGIVWGEFYATRHTSQDPFADDAMDYVDVLSAIVGAAIGRSVRESELAHLANHDALTGVLNRRGLDHAATRIFDVPGGTSRVVTTLGLDVDGLKQVNDRHGHARGDELLSDVALSLQEAFGSFPGSVIARVGGDEFTVLLPDVDPSVATELVTALCREKDESWSFEPTAGISAGVASTLLTGRADASPSDLLAAADRALYAAKQLRAAAVVVSDEMSA